MKKILLILLVAALSSFTIFIKSWQPVPDAKVNFSIDGLFGIDVNGTVGDLRSDIHFFPDDLAHSVITATINPSTIDTENKKRDKHLRTPDFFDVEKFPTITFTSRIFRKVGEYYVVEGELSLKETKKLISIPFEFSGSANSATFIGDFDINRLDYGVGKKSMMMGTQVRIHLNIPVTRK